MLVNRVRIYAGRYKMLRREMAKKHGIAVTGPIRQSFIAASMRPGPPIRLRRHRRVMRADKGGRTLHLTEIAQPVPLISNRAGRRG